LMLIITVAVAAIKLAAYVSIAFYYVTMSLTG
jgi:hypothetical protein